jgi:hypothetical protein
VALSFGFRLWAAVAVVALCGLALERLSAPRLARFALALSRTWAAMLLVLFASVYATPYTGPLADAPLGWPDPTAPVEAAAWLQTHHLWSVAVAGYNSGQLALIALLAYLAWSQAPGIHRVGDAFVAAGLVGIVLYVLAPAAGPADSVGCAAGSAPGWAELRAGATWTYSEGIPGLVAAPSFHAVSGALLWLASPPGWVRVVAGAWAIVLVGTAVPVGAHYGADVGLGLVLAGWAWRVSR